MYRIATGIFLGCLGLACTAQAAVSVSAPSGVGTVDTLPPRIKVLTPGENELFLRLDPIYFSWQMDERHPGSNRQTQQAEVLVAGQVEDQVGVNPHRATDSWNWTPAEGPAAMARLRVTLTDAFGNPAEAWGNPFTLLPAASGTGESAPRRTALGGAHPNPFNPRTTLRFELAADGPARIEIFDLRGRRVRTLLDRTLAAGDHAVGWDGTDDASRPLAGGTYVIRLVAGQGEDRTLQSRKAVLLP